MVLSGRPWCTVGQGGRTARRHRLCLLTPAVLLRCQLKAWTSDVSCREIYTLLPLLPLPCSTKPSGFNVKFSGGFPEGSMQEKD